MPTRSPAPNESANGCAEQCGNGHQRHHQRRTAISDDQRRSLAAVRAATRRALQANEHQRDPIATNTSPSA
jgi:hypothetical protein